MTEQTVDLRDRFYDFSDQDLVNHCDYLRQRIDQVLHYEETLAMLRRELHEAEDALEKKHRERQVQN